MYRVNSFEHLIFSIFQFLHEDDILTPKRPKGSYEPVKSFLAISPKLRPTCSKRNLNCENSKFAIFDKNFFHHAVLLSTYYFRAWNKRK